MWKRGMAESANPTVIIGIGLACEIAFSFLAFSNLNLFNRSLQTVGVVTNVQYGDSSDIITLQFIDKRNGNQITASCFTGGLAPWTCSYHSVGERVYVLYDSEFPSKVMINEGFWFFWLLPFGLLVYGVPILPMGIVSYLMRQRRTVLTSYAIPLCSKCGKQSPTGAVFCSSYGNRLTPASQAYTSLERVRNILILIYLIISVCFILYIFVVVV